MTPVAVLLVTLVGIVTSAAVPGTCPDPPAALNFNATAMDGIWYDQAHTERGTGLQLRCDLVKIRSPRPSHISFTSFTYSSATKKTIGVSGEADILTNVGKLQVKIPSLRLNGEVRVLSTDYVTFAVLWACSSSGGSYNERALVLTREKNPSASLITAGTKVLENNGLPKKDLSYSSHHKCHQYDLDAENLSNSLGPATSMGSLLSVYGAAPGDAITSSTASTVTTASTTTTAPSTTPASRIQQIGSSLQNTWKRITG